MSIVQKLPIGLGVACFMMMSSCSKENVQVTPEAATEIADTTANLKAQTPPWIPPTKGYTGVNSYPNLWEGLHTYPFTSDPAKYPSGTSNFSAMWGNNAFPWLEAMPVIPNQPWDTFVTLTTSTIEKLKRSKQAGVGTKIRFLIPGVKYSFTFYVASARPKSGGTYVNKCDLQLISSKGGFYEKAQTFDLTLATFKENTWVKKTINFTATNSEMDLKLGATSLKEDKYAYAHIFVGSEAVKKLY